MKITEHREEYLKSTAEEKGKLLAKTYGLAGHQVWKHKQSGKWIISHAGIQSIAAQEALLVNYDVHVCERSFVVVEARPYTLGEVDKDGYRDNIYGQSTFGEASPDNCKMQYYAARS